MPLFNQSQLLFGGHVRSVGGTHPLWRIATIYGSVWLRCSRRTSPSACLRWLPSRTTRLGTFIFLKEPSDWELSFNNHRGTSHEFSTYPIYLHPVSRVAFLSGAHLRISMTLNCLLIVKLVSHIQHWGTECFEFLSRCKAAVEALSVQGLTPSLVFNAKLMCQRTMFFPGCLGILQSSILQLYNI